MAVVARITAPLTESIQYFQQLSREKQAASGILAAASLPLLYQIFALIRQDYRGWMALGPGGLPYNVWGWLINSALRPLGRDAKGTGCYDSAKLRSMGGDVGNRGWLGDLPVRTGARPHIGPWTAPHRQLSQHSSAALHKALRLRFDSIIAQNQDIITTKTSVLERQGEAIFIADDIPSPHPIAAGVRREITHIHESAECSLHCTLSPKDAKLVVANGWGERHPLAGSMLFSRCYTMLYTPRNEKELDVVCRIVCASIAFMTGGKDVKA